MADTESKQMQKGLFTCRKQSNYVLPRYGPRTWSSSHRWTPLVFDGQLTKRLTDGATHGRHNQVRNDAHCDWQPQLRPRTDHTVRPAWTFAVVAFVLIAN